MAMGRRQHRERQEDLWVAHTQLATAPGHPFYERLNAVLDAEGFDRFVEELCSKFYAPQFGRPSLTPGIYFRSLLIGYFEGIGAERGIAWRMADSLGLRRFPPQQAKTACRGPRFRWHRAGRGHAGPLDDFAHPAADRFRDACGCIRVGVGGVGAARTHRGQARGH
jgi:hypothetical protein